MTSRVLHKDRAVTVIRITAGDERDAWFVASTALQPAQPVIDLSITITSGTNTAEEKENWQQAAWALLHGVTGGGSVPNYVSVVELAGGDWGYNGQTQANRKATKTCMQKN